MSVFEGMSSGGFLERDIKGQGEEVVKNWLFFGDVLNGTSILKFYFFFSDAPQTEFS